MIKLKLVQQLIAEIEKDKIVYCHWKSNSRLKGVFSGDEDIDLFVRRDNAVAFQNVMAQLGFKLATQHFMNEQKAIYHYYGLDEETCKIVHVHVYYQIVTGGTVLKNYRFPVEQILLEGENTFQGLKIPEKPAELALLVIRKIIECGSIIELFFVKREMLAIQEELDWLLQDKAGDNEGIIDDVMAKLKTFLPSVDRTLFERSLRALRINASAYVLWHRGVVMRKALRAYRINSSCTTMLLTLVRFTWMVIERIILNKRSRGFVSGGSIIAIVGPEATGKSTILEKIRGWLGKEFAVLTFHTGKPPSTFMTFFPNVFMPILRKKYSKFRTCNIEANIQNDSNESLSKKRLTVYAVRSLMIAFDRRALLKRIYRKASRGCIVICDRYPTPNFGAMDSAQLDLSSKSIRESRILLALAKIERRMYQQMPLPDLVIQLTLPVDVAVRRNVVRNKVEIEDEDYVRRRHLQSKLQNYSLSFVKKVDTNKDLKVTMPIIKKAIWKQL